MDIVKRTIGGTLCLRVVAFAAVALGTASATDLAPPEFAPPAALASTFLSPRPVSGSIVLTLQDGAANSATVRQDSANSVVGLVQQGTDNLMIVSQLGDDNLIGLAQIGNQNDAVFSQQGGNRALVMQFGDLNFADVQQGAGSPPMIVRQFGNGYVKTIQY